VVVEMLRQGGSLLRRVSPFVICPLSCCFKSTIWAVVESDGGLEQSVALAGGQEGWREERAHSNDV